MVAAIGIVVVKLSMSIINIYGEGLHTCTTGLRLNAINRNQRIYNCVVEHVNVN